MRISIINTVNSTSFGFLPSKSDRLEKKYLQKLFNNDTFLHKASLYDMRKMFNDLADYPDILEKALLSENNFGLTPIYSTGNNCLDFILSETAHNKTLLTKMLQHKNKYGDTPLHWSNSKNTKTYISYVKNYPDLLKEVALTKNRDGDLPAHIITANAYIDALKDDPETLKQMLFTQNNLGQTPLHGAQSIHCVVKNCNQKLYIMNSLNDEKTIAELLLVQDNKKKYPITKYDKEYGKEDYAKIMDKILSLINSPSIDAVTKSALCNAYKDCDPRILSALKEKS